MKSVGEQNVDKTQGLKKSIFVPDTAEFVVVVQVVRNKSLLIGDFFQTV